MLKILWLGHGGNRYLVEDIFQNVLCHIQDIKLTIISEWEPNDSFVKQGVEYVKYDLNRWQNIYKEADVILCPQNPIQPAKSHIKVITAFALGKPVICSRHPAYLEIVKDGYNGYFFSNYSDFIDIIDKLRDKDHRDRLGENGYNTIIYRFNPSTIAQKLSNIICQDLHLNGFGSWQPSTQKSGLNRIVDHKKETVKVDVVYVPLPTRWQSYGDFVYDAFLNVLGPDNIRQHNTLNDMIEYNNKHGWKRDLFVFIEFNQDWYNIPDEILNRSIMYGWDTHGHFMFSHLYNLCRRFRKVFISGKDDVNRIYSSGLSNVEWIPEAYASSVHNVNLRQVNKRVIFVGQIDSIIRDSGGFTRYDYIKYLSDKFKDRFLAIRNVYGMEYSKLVTQSYASLDLPIAHNIGTRCFETAAMGVIPIRADNRAPGFDEYFRDGSNVMLFEPGDLKDLSDKIDMILSHHYVDVVDIGHNMSLKMKHQSYDNRIRYILRELEL